MRGKSLGQLFISIGIIIAAYLIGNSFIQRNSENNTIWVKGLGKQNFTSDLIVWRGSFTTVDNNLQNAYSKLDSDRVLIKEFLSKYNIGDSEIVFNSVNINKDFTYSYDQKGTSTRTFNGYVLRQEVKIESKKVEETEKIAREVTELINKGVEFYSEPPQYFYTQLASLKQEMIANATTDARLRAEQINILLSSVYDIDLFSYLFDNLSVLGEHPYNHAIIKISLRFIMLIHQADRLTYSSWVNL